MQQDIHAIYSSARHMTEKTPSSLVSVSQSLQKSKANDCAASKREGRICQWKEFEADDALEGEMRLRFAGSCINFSAVARSALIGPKSPVHWPGVWHNFECLTPALTISSLPTMAGRSDSRRIARDSQLVKANGCWGLHATMGFIT